VSFTGILLENEVEFFLFISGRRGDSHRIHSAGPGSVFIDLAALISHEMATLPFVIPHFQEHNRKFLFTGEGNQAVPRKKLAAGDTQSFSQT
jgi:hypothetical protein